MLGSRPHVSQRHYATLASIGAIVAERLPKIIEEQLFERKDDPQAMGFASIRKRITSSHVPPFEPLLNDVKHRDSM